MLSNLELARSAAEFVCIMQRDPLQRPTVILVPGHDAKRYRVILRWNKTSVSAECAIDAGLGFIPCPSGDKMCYHRRAALIAAFKDRGWVVHFGQSKDSLARLKRIGGNLIAFYPWKSERVNWVLARRIKKAQAA